MVETLEFNTLCIRCMHNKGHSERCPVCGYDERAYKEHPLYLRPKTELKNQYIVGMPLGQGGFGITYLGLDKWLQKKVAIKEYLPAALATRDVFTSIILPLTKQEETFRQGLQLFINEARHLAKFDHPNIVRVINFFEENQTGYMVMDYLEGFSLVDILNRAGGRLTIDETLTIVLPILDALIASHAEHIYHRDISLQNVRVLTSGVPILIDFGAARHIVGEQSRTLDLVLKHGYSPLEQYSGRGKIGPWTDIYASGALLYLLITGILPPAATDRFCEDNLKAPVERGVAISMTVNNAIMRALAIKLENRFQTVQEFKAALRGQQPTKLNDTPLNSPPPTPKKKLNPLPRKRVKVIIAGWLLLTIVMSLFFYNKNEGQLVNTLFEQAQVQWTSEKLLSPTGDNVYDTYQQILKRVPHNAQAQAGILKIAHHYQQLAQKAQQEGQLVESLKMIKNGLQVAPNHADLLTLQQKVIAELARHDQQIQDRAVQIEQLLNQSAQHLALSQLEAAKVAYQKVFTLDPDNKLAHAGLQRVAEEYRQLALAQNNNFYEALSLVEKGLMLFPKHHELQVLKTELQEKQLAQQREQETKQAQQRQIEEWLKIAEVQLTALRLTEPAGNNAYETYQKILKIIPEQAQAQAGLVKIADQYEKLARIERDDLHKNLALINKGLKVLPTHTGLMALAQAIQQKMELAQSQETPPSPLDELALPPPTKVINVTSPSIPQSNQFIADKSSKINVKQPIPENTVQNLLTIAKQHLEVEQFEAAYQTYQNVLTLDPNNGHAMTGLQQIAQHYEQLARRQNEQGHLSESLSLIEKGLAASPTNSGLLALQIEVNRRLDEKTATETQPPRLIFTPSF